MNWEKVCAGMPDLRGWPHDDKGQMITYSCYNCRWGFNDPSSCPISTTRVPQEHIDCDDWVPFKVKKEE